MGLDLVELTLTVEDAFDVRIPDERAGEMLTVGDLFEFLVEETCDDTRQRGVCLSAATFFAVRQALGRVLGAKLRFRPNDAVDALLPKRHRARLWRELARELDARLPPLSRPVWVVVAGASAVAALTALVAAVVHGSAGPGGAALAGVATALSTGAGIAFVTQRCETVPGRRIARFRELSHMVLALNYAKLSARFDAWTRDDVWEALRRLVVDQLGVRPEKVTPDATWIGDLGAD